jgi:hypothetical protein
MDLIPTSISRVGALLGRRPASWRKVMEGLNTTSRWIVRFEDGGSAFLKVAGSVRAAQWLRWEYDVYRSVREDFLPALIGWLDDPLRPILILEDLSDAVWPPPWTPELIQRVPETLLRVRVADVPLRRTLEQTGRLEARSWRKVRADPRPFLSLGLSSRAWLERALPPLQGAEAAARLDGADLLHGDVKGGNVCFVGSRTVFVDWNWACRGNGVLDAAMWLPALEEEGGPPPERLLPGQGPVAAAIAGNLALRAAKPPPAQIPDLRKSQARKLRHALAWACRTLHLPLPDFVDDVSPLDGATLSV